MAKAKAVLVQREDAWFLALAERTEFSQLEPICDSQADPAELASAVVQRLASTNGRVFQLAVLVSSSRVFHSSFPASEIGGAKNSKAIPYRLEADLPLSAEELLADWSFGEDQSVSGFAMDRSWINARILALVDQAKESGFQVEVGLLSARSLATCQSLVEQGRVPESSILLIENADKIEMFKLESKVPTQWRIMHSSSSVAEWKLLLADSSDPVFILNSSEPNDWAQNLDRPTTLLGDNQEQLALKCASRLLARPRLAWINFARDASLVGGGDQVQQNWSRLLTVASVCVLLVAGAIFYRSFQLKAETARLQAEQGVVFTSTFPGQRQPAAILRRFRSEYAKTVGARATNSAEVQTPQEAIPILGELVASLPLNIPFAVSELRVEDGAIYLDLEIQKHEDAGLIAEALGSERIRLGPPSTDSTGEKVTALLRGTLQAGGKP
ncbi:MAG: hypothetical protein AAF483_12170 [Planctomycetota bacterium]